MDFLSTVVKLAIGGLIGFLVAETIVTVVRVIKDRITAHNLGKYSREALASDERTKDLLCEAIEIEVAKRRGNVLSLNALRNGQKVASIRLEGKEVADDICVGMTVSA